jgi:nitrile hydratase accessory protein
MARITPLPFQPHDHEGPVFKEPWEAQAFGLVIALYEEGLFTWSEWADTLSAEITAAQSYGDQDLGNTYYQHWLKALERMVIEKKISATLEIDSRKEQWRQAYLNTPHGQPIELKAAKLS